MSTKLYSAIYFAVLLFTDVLAQSASVVNGNARRRTSPGGGSAGAVPSAGRGGRTWAGATGSGSCRCVPDQWEGVLRSVEREFDLTGREFEAGNGVEEEMEEAERDAGKTHLMQNPLVGTAEMESITAVHYDFTNGLLMTRDMQTGARMLADYKAGVQYVIGATGCRVASVRQTMKRMCLPDGATFQGRYSLGRDQQVSMWKHTGPNNSTLRTIVSSRFCLPINEETFSASAGFASVTSSFYVNVNVGIEDRSVFDVPRECTKEAAAAAAESGHEDDETSA